MDWTPRALNCHSVNDVFGRVKNGPQEYLRTLQGYAPRSRNEPIPQSLRRHRQLVDRGAESRGIQQVVFGIPAEVAVD